MRVAVGEAAEKQVAVVVEATVNLRPKDCLLALLIQLQLVLVVAALLLIQIKVQAVVIQFFHLILLVEVVGAVLKQIVTGLLVLLPMVTAVAVAMDLEQMALEALEMALVLLVVALVRQIFNPLEVEVVQAV